MIYNGKDISESDDIDHEEEDVSDEIDDDGWWLRKTNVINNLIINKFMKFY